MGEVGEPGIVFAPVDPESQAFLTTIPWCKSYYDDPTLKSFTLTMRDKHHNINGAHTLMTKTLAVPDAIAHRQGFYRPAQPGSGNRWGDMFHLVSLGSGLNGHPDKAHGGVLSCILDEVIGMVTLDARDRSKIIYTLYLKVEYKKAVSTPTVVLCHAWLDKKTEGKKIFGHATIEDGEGTVFTTGEALFIQKDQPGSEAKL
ncbi:hypothetical protein B7463_g4163, partial [Scytalidium lignicola]